jgi:hypothetical protein
MDFLLPVRDVSHYSICTVTSVTNITVIYVVTVMPRAKVATPARFRQETIAVRQMLGRVEKVGLHPAIAGGSFAGQNCHIPGQSFASLQVCGLALEQSAWGYRHPDRKLLNPSLSGRLPLACD